MAYTQTINSSTPTGATAANTADEEFRNLKTAINERLAHVVGGNSFDINSDPIVPVGSRLLDATLGLNYVAGPYHLGSYTGLVLNQYGQVEIPATGLGSIVIPLPFRPGVTLDSIDLYFTRDDNDDNITGILHRVQFPSTIESLFSANAATLAGPLNINMSPNHQVAAGYAYFFTINYAISADGTATIFGIKVNVA